MFKKSLSTLFGKFTLSFFVLSVMVGATILVLFYSNKRIEHHNELKNKVASLILELEEIARVSKANTVVDEDYKVNFSTKVDVFRVDFESLLSKQLQDKINMSDSSGKELPVSELNKEEQVLYFTNDFWKKVRKHVDYIQYNDLVYDSLYTVVQLQEKLDVKDSAIKYLPLVNELSKKTLSFEARSAFSNVNLLIRKMKSKLELLHDKYLDSFNKVSFWHSIIVGLLFLVDLSVVFGLYTFLRKEIFTPINSISKKAKRIISGKIDETITGVNEGELGEIASQFNVLALDIRNAHVFIKNLNLDDIDEVALSHDENEESTSTLTNALIEMRGKLSEIAINERQRNWVIEGQALFSDILSKFSSDFDQLSDEIVRKLVQYIGALQGGLFILKSTNDGEEYLELSSCFAYDRKKFITNRVEKGEGVVGQVWQEGKASYITQLPEDHMLIKSGLGDQRPSSLLVVPLIESGVTYGVVEIAAFRKIEKYKIDFVYKIAENIATALSGVEINKRTQLLLLESQDLTSKMKEQEEEMLQNLEELQATQEEMRRREIQKENEMNQLQERLEKKLEESNSKEKDLLGDIAGLKQDLENAQTDNEGVRKLSAEIEEMTEAHELKIKDLEETIRIKDMRVDKLRKKIANQK